MTSAGEKLLRMYVKRCFPGEIQLMNHRDPSIINPNTGKSLEIDIYLPMIKVGFEFHGRQHKTDESQRERDKIKRRRAKELGIVLFEIWTATLEQDLYEYIRSRLPSDIKISKPDAAFRKFFSAKVSEYKKNIYKMNKTLSSNTFIKRRKK